ncbi:MAG: protease inhibitor I42 family protein [Eubacteriales bacterium]|nr:protease inhibitor I42 family protein [Eubacteriales bacterium]
MKKLISLLLAVMMLVVPMAFAEEVQEENNWFELSNENTVLTVRLPGNTKSGLNWYYEISNPEALELITTEVIEGESEGMAGTPTTFVASFMTTASAENTTSLLFHYTEDVAADPVASCVLELEMAVNNEINVASSLVRTEHADWIEYDAEQDILLLTFEGIQEEGYVWNFDLLDEKKVELITCETENGFVGSFCATMEEAGFTEIYVNYTDEEGFGPDTYYTVGIFVNEGGGISVESVDEFVIY